LAAQIGEAGFLELAGFTVIGGADFATRVDCIKDGLVPQNVQRQDRLGNITTFVLSIAYRVFN